MRILIPILAILIAIAFVLSFALRGDSSKPPPPTESELATESTEAVEAAEGSPEAADDQPEPDTTTAPIAEADETPIETTADETPTETTPEVAESSAALTDYSAGLTAQPATNPGEAAIGSVDPDSGFKLRVDLVRWGAGISKITLADFRKDVDQPLHYTVAREIEALGELVYPYAGRSITINGRMVDLLAIEAGSVANGGGPIWSLLESDEKHATYQLLIVDNSGDPVLEVQRTYRTEPGSYDVRLEQQLINRTDTPLSVVWSQNAHGDVVNDGPAYLGDRRLFVTGYFDDKYDTRRLHIYTEHGFHVRSSMVGAYIKAQKNGVEPNDIPNVWPNSDIDQDAKLAWLASENRYFGMVTHLPVDVPADDADELKPADVPDLQQRFAEIGARVFPSYRRNPDARPEQRGVIFTLATGPITLDPGAAHDVNVAIFAGPRDSSLFKEQPYKAMGFPELVRYELGCTWFTFQWLARLLLRFLEGIHFVVRDWGVAIIILVIIVRGLLHPITKGAQVKMMTTSKQMQALQPELEKLKKKYKDNQKMLQQEMMKLYREKGVNLFNMLGCLPMFLQMPIWVALYAMLYFAIELRHEPAFYGVFQLISGGHWHFLESLSGSDRFIQLFAAPKPIHLLFITLDFQYLNLLPILMGVVFFLQQKFMQPPPAPTESDQQAQMRKQQMLMMRFMVLLFPLLLYSAPCGLTLYILASTSAGILDSYLVRKHIKEQEASGELFKPKQRKPGGFMDRMQKLYEQRMQQMQAAQKPRQKGSYKKR